MKSTHITWLIGGVVIAAAVAYFIVVPRKSAQLDSFAGCLEEQGAVFYGAFWCPHCRDQKALFGRSASKMPYVECSTPDGKGQLEVCADENITSYPAWEFASGERRSGVLSLEELASETGCELPQE